MLALAPGDSDPDAGGSPAVRAARGPSVRVAAFGWESPALRAVRSLRLARSDLPHGAFPAARSV